MANITGTSGNDTLNGTDAGDLIDGLEGDDVLKGGAGNDTLNGGAGRDVLNGGVGDDVLNGGDDDDVLNDHGKYNDAGGNDTMNGGGGNDRFGIYRSSDEPGTTLVLDGGAGDDRFDITIDSLENRPGPTRVIIDAGIGDDYIDLGGSGIDADITLGAGRDTIRLLGMQSFLNWNDRYQPTNLTVGDFVAGDSGDILSWTYVLPYSLIDWNQDDNPFGSGHARLLQDGSDTVLQVDVDGGADGYQTLVRFQNAFATAFTAANFDGYAPDGSLPAGVTLTGAGNRDELTGTIVADELRGAGGNDHIEGLAGADLIIGGDGDDDLFGGMGDDILEGGVGRDTLHGDSGSDVLRGGDGNDDLSDANSADNYLYGEGGNDTLVMSYNRHQATGFTYLDGGDGDDVIAVSLSSDSALEISGGAGADRVTVFFEMGTATIRLGSGIDTLQLRYGTAYGPPRGDIVIEDFAVGDSGEQLQFRQYLPRILSGWDPATNPFATGYLRLVQSGTAAVLQMDYDGGGDDFVPHLTFQNVNAAALTPYNLDSFDSLAVFGTDGPDFLHGTTGDDDIRGLGGDDEIFASRGHDVIDGGAGWDGLRIWSSVGLPAGAHNYTITADHASDASGTLDTSFSGIERIWFDDTSSTTGNVTIDASTTGTGLSVRLGVGTHDVATGAGDDSVQLLGGSGTFDGGAGNDQLTIQISTLVDGNPLIMTETAGVMTLTRSGAGNLTARNVENLSISTTGGALNIDASGVSGTFRFTTSIYADTVIGGAGETHFYSTAWGNGDGDLFTGGGGADLYVFRGFSALGGATITDLSENDVIALSEIPNAHFIGTAAFSGTAGELRYATANGKTQLIGDADGDGVGESVLTLANREMSLRETYGGSLFLQIAPNQITGTEAGEALTGTAYNDVVTALGGADTIKVSRGVDTVDGGAAADVLELDAATLALGAGPHQYTINPNHLTDGSGAVDTSFTAIERLRVIDFTGSNVTLDASGLGGPALTVAVRTGVHSLIGGASADSFSIAGGSGSVDGGDGQDGVAVTVNDAVTVSRSGDATILTPLFGGALSLRNIEAVAVASGSGGLHVDAAAAAIGFNFQLTAFADIVTGGTGNDVFVAPNPANSYGDVLTGGGGADGFNFAGLTGFSDVEITDFGVDDAIRLTGLPANARFIGGAEFSGSAGEYRYVSGSGLTGLVADLTGDGIADSGLLISNGAFVLAETATGSGILHIVGELPADADADNVMTGAGGADYFDSGAGNDVISGGGGADTLNGGEGSDTLFSADRYMPFGYPYSIHHLNNPVLDTGAEADRLNGGGGVDYLFAGFNDTVDGGGSSDDVLYLSLMGSLFGVTLDFRQVVLANGTGTIRGIEGVGWLQGSNQDDDFTLSGTGSYAPGAVVYAMGGNDRVIADYKTSAIFGGDGHDFLDGRLGNYLQRIDGGAGNDTIYTNPNSFTAAYGGSGNDTLYAHGEAYGGAGDDTIWLAETYYRGGVYGDEGDDEIHAAKVGNYIAGGTGADRLFGNDGADTLASGGFEAGSLRPSDDVGREKDVLTAGAGDDLLAIGWGDDADGGSGTDLLQLSLGGAGAGVTLDAAQLVGAGPFSLGGGTIRNIERIAELNGSDHADTLNMAGVGGAVTVDGAGGDDAIWGTGANDALGGGAGDDMIDGGDGGDKIGGGVGNDVANGGAGADDIDGEVGQDWLLGGAGADVAAGGDGDDSVWGDAGDDVLIGGAGDDTLVGGAGVDTVSYAGALSGVEIDLSYLEEQLTRGAGVDTLVSIENVIGSAFDDVLAGNSGSNTLSGGFGNDRFVFNDTALAARDTIADFNVGDRIDLEAIDANGARAGDAAFAFVGSAAFGGVAGQLRVSGSGTSWLVEGDLNGDRAADFSIAVTTLSSGLGLAASDFLL